MNFFKTISMLLLALLCACCTFIVLIQEDSWFIARVQHEIETIMSKNFECQFKAQVARVNLLSGKLTLKNIVVKPQAGDAWHWTAREIELKIQYLPSYQQKKAVAALALQQMQLHSTVADNTLAIMPHLQKFIRPSATTIPVQANTVTCSEGSWHIHHANMTTTGTFNAFAQLQKKDDDAAYRIRAVIEEGRIFSQTNSYCDAFKGTLDGMLGLRPHMLSTISFTSSCSIAEQLPDDALCKISGHWSPTAAQIHFATDKRQLYGNIVLDSSTNQSSITVTAPCSYLAHHAGIRSPIGGSCTVAATSSMTQPREDCTIDFTIAPVYQSYTMPTIRASLQYAQNALHGKLNATYHDMPCATGTISVDLAQASATGTITNTIELALPDAWKLPAQALSCSYEYHNGITTATYQADCTHPTITNARTIDGTIEINAKQIVLHAQRGTFACSLKAKIDPSLITCDLIMQGGNIRVPYTYNLVHDMQGRLYYLPASRQLRATNLALHLHKGTISVSRADAQFDDTYNLVSLFIPCLVHNCMFGIKKDLFAVVSGALTMSYQKNKSAQLNGFIALDRSHIRNNILSEEFQKMIFKHTTGSPFSKKFDLTFDVDILTCSPLRVKTPFLEAAADAHIKLMGDVANPSLTGEITLKNGSLLFPYKPLQIKRGKIYFVPSQFEDPVIDIVAENNIRKYAVRMTVDGTAKDSHISFDATPALQEEQIVALLLGGSEDGSLFLAMPNSVMNSIEKLLFGPATTSSQFQRALKNIFSPLKNLRVIPSFSDQTARGGLRGSLVIDVNERLRGIIEHNFSLPEDVVIQVEYDLSDDARIRAIKDERGDLGAELEGRWKF